MSCERRHCSLHHLLIIAGFLLVDTLNLGIFTKGNLQLCCISPSTWGNQRRERSNYPLSRIKQNSGAVAGSPREKIGEFPTTFYLYFLVLLVYLPVFIFVSFIKK